MAKFAKLSLTSKVIRIGVINDDLLIDHNGNPLEQLGIDFLSKLYSYPFWVQTSDSMRKNEASKGFKYDEDRDAFIPPKPHASWTLNEDTCQWDSPIAHPDDGKFYTWNEETISWEEIQ